MSGASMGTPDEPETVLPHRWERVINRAPCGICGRDYDDGHRGAARDHRYRNAIAGPGVSPHVVTAVAAVMANRASLKGEFFITDEELSDRLDLAEKTVRRVRTHMAEAGYLIRTRKGGGRSGKASEYRLALPPVAEHRTPETGESFPKHRTPETGESETLDIGALNTGHQGAKHWTPETPQVGVLQVGALQGETLSGAAGAAAGESADESDTQTPNAPVPAVIENHGTKNLIDQWVAHRSNTGRAEPSPQIRGHMAAEVAKLLKSGVPFADVAAALVDMERQGGKGPGFLPYAVEAIQNPAQPPKSRKQSERDAILDAAMARALVDEPNPFMTDEEHAIARGGRDRFASQQQSDAAEQERKRRRAEIDGCDQCDENGYRGGLPCAHDPGQGERAKSFAADIRQAIRKAPDQPGETGRLSVVADRPIPWQCDSHQHGDHDAPCKACGRARVAHDEAQAAAQANAAIENRRREDRIARHRPAITDLLPYPLLDAVGGRAHAEWLNAAHDWVGAADGRQLTPELAADIAQRIARQSA